jgi:hypothetical protein
MKKILLFGFLVMLTSSAVNARMCAAISDDGKNFEKAIKVFSQEIKVYLKEKSFIPRYSDIKDKSPIKALDVARETKKEIFTELIRDNGSLSKEVDAARKRFLNVFTKIVKDMEQIPSTVEETYALIASKLGRTPQDVRAQFGEGRMFRNLEEMIDAGRITNPSAYGKIVDLRFYSKAKEAKMVAAMRDSWALGFMDIPQGQKVPENMMDALEVLSKNFIKGQVTPIIAAPAFSDVGNIPHSNTKLFNSNFIHINRYPRVKLDGNTMLYNPGVLDKAMNPATGVRKGGFGPGDKVILYHPWAYEKSEYSAFYEHDDTYTVTTGSPGEFNYDAGTEVGMYTDDKATYMQRKIRSILVLDRRYRDLKVNSVTGTRPAAAPRRLPWLKARWGNSAGFVDGSRIFTPTGVERVNFIPVIAPGDIHLGETDPSASNALIDFLHQLKVTERVKDPLPGKPVYKPGKVKLGALVFNDLTEGTPANGHNTDRFVSTLTSILSGEADYARHYGRAVTYLNLLQEYLPDTQIVLTSGNHDNDWIERKLQDFMKGGYDPNRLSFEFVTDLVREMQAGGNVWRLVLEKLGLNTKNVIFEKPGEMLTFGIDDSIDPKSMHSGFAVLHGQNGANGSKHMSLAVVELAYGAAIAAHTHSVGQFGTATNPGTNTKRRMGFHRGPGNVSQGIVIGYGKEAMQLYRMVEGRFLPAPILEGETFSELDESFPVLIDWKEPEIKTTSQHRSPNHLRGSAARSH